jgi:hypothetical protein
MMAYQKDTANEFAPAAGPMKTSSLGPVDYRSRMADTMMAAQEPGAVKGAGGYVYKPVDGGIKIVIDGAGRGTEGVVVKPGMVGYKEIAAELGLPGADAPAPAAPSEPSAPAPDTRTSEQPAPAPAAVADTRTSEQPPKRTIADVRREGMADMKESVTNLPSRIAERINAAFKAQGSPLGDTIKGASIKEPTDEELDAIIARILGETSAA